MARLTDSAKTPRSSPVAVGLPILGLWAVAVGWLLALGAPVARGQGLTVRIADWAQMPLSGNLTATTANPVYLARVNFLREEPGNTGRVWICDLNGSIFIVNKGGDFASRTAALLANASAGAGGTPYLDFNGTGAGEPTNRPTAAGTGTTSVNGNGLFARFTKASGYANGLVTVQFDPDYVNNGRFYTIHIETNTSDGNAERLPANGKYPGFNTTGYTPTAALSGGPGPATRQAVLIEWTDTNRANATFEGTARELLRIVHTGSIHPMGDLIFNPLATDATHPEWGVMYVAIGDGGSGESNANDDGVAGLTGGDRHYTPQRLDLLQGKIIRIIPNLAQSPGTSTVSPNGRYRIPNDNPFATGFAGARGEIWSYGHRNPHRFSWDAVSGKLAVCEIGLHAWEEVNFIERGANYGYAEREGPQRLVISTTAAENQTLTALPAPDSLPVRLNASATQGTVTPRYPAAAYGHSAAYGDAIASGFVYRGTLLPQLQGKFVFGDITTGRLFYCDYAELLAAHDADPATLAGIREIRLQWDSPYDAPNAGLQTYARMFEIVEIAYHARGGIDGDLPGGATVSGNGRADLRLAVDAAGELYLTSKSDGFIRAITAVPSPWFAQQPAGSTVVAGQNGAFTASALGQPVPGLQWQRRAAGAATWSNVPNAAPYAGATSATLQITGTTLAMNGDQFRCGAANGVFDDATSSAATLTVTTAKSSWLLAHFTAEQRADLTFSGDDADPEHDGLSNFAEYSFDFDPLADSTRFLPAPVRTGGLLRLTFSALRPELDYLALGSPDLTTWSATGVSLEVNGNQVTATYAPPGGQRGFLRVKVTPKP